MSHKAIEHTIKLQADAQGNPPSRIQLMSTGDWHAPWHGNFEMTSDDLAEMVQHFNDGVATVEGSKKLPINYGHDMTGKAAGWITALTVENAGSELWGDVEWTPEGEQMLRDGSFRYISPEWNPRSFPYQDPEDEELWIDNVFTGAGLTNIPLFKKLKPIMASLVQPKAKQASVVSNSDNKPNGEQSMDLEALRAKKPADLNEDEKKFLEEHKADLTDGERKTFGLEDTSDDSSDDGTTDESNDSGDDAADATESESGNSDVKGNAKTISISASRLAKLEADAAAGLKASQELELSKAKGIVASAVSKGQIKTGDSERWTKVLLASGAQRKEVESLISGLPVNESLGKEAGDGGTQSTAAATEELNAKVAQKIKASAADGKPLPYVEARKQILAEDSALATRIKEEEETN